MRPEGGEEGGRRGIASAGWGELDGHPGVTVVAATTQIDAATAVFANPGINSAFAGRDISSSDS